MDIFNYLNSSPDMRIQLIQGKKTLTYERVNDARGFMESVRIVETGEIIPLPPGH